MTTTPPIIPMEVIMWIRTQGGYLLNLDRTDFIRTEDNLTLAYTSGTTHIIAEGDITEAILGAVRCNTNVLEVYGDDRK